MLGFVLELVFGAIFEGAIAFFFPRFADAGAAQKTTARNADEGYSNDDWYVARLVGFTVCFAILIGGLWFSYLRP